MYTSLKQPPTHAGGLMLKSVLKKFHAHTDSTQALLWCCCRSRTNDRSHPPQIYIAERVLRRGSLQALVSPGDPRAGQHGPQCDSLEHVSLFLFPCCIAHVSFIQICVRVYLHISFSPFPILITDRHLLYTTVHVFWVGEGRVFHYSHRAKETARPRTGRTRGVRRLYTHGTSGGWWMGILVLHAWLRVHLGASGHLLDRKSYSLNCGRDTHLQQRQRPSGTLFISRGINSDPLLWASYIHIS